MDGCSRLHPQTVATWLARSRFEPRRSRPRGSILDPFKPRITRLLETHPYSAQQIFQRLREEGYGGGMTILRDYVRRIRPPKRPVYLKLHFAPGECAQVDWGAYGTVAVDNTRRRPLRDPLPGRIPSVRRSMVRPGSGSPAPASPRGAFLAG